MKAIAWVLVAVAALPAHAAMYKWVDAQGRVQYSDTPPPPNARKVEEQKIVPNTIQTTGAPFSVKEAAKRNPVTLWLTDCGEYCTKAREYLARRGIPHTLRNPSRQSEQDAWKQVSGGDNSVPLLMIGDKQKLKGFDEAQWSAALDGAGYPRTAPALKPQTIPNVEPDVVVPPSAAAPKPPAVPASAAK
jgi:glutaredoxin